MSEQPAKTSRAKSWWESVKAQFHRIIWPSRRDTTVETVVVLIVSVILGLIISIFDSVLLQIVDWIISI